MDDTATTVDAEAAEASQRVRPVPWWVSAGAVLAAATAPHVAFAVKNWGELLDVGTLLTWWATTAGVSMALLALAARAGARLRAWAGTVLVVVLYLLLSFPRQALPPRPWPLSTADLAWLGASVVLLGLVWRWGHSRPFQMIVALASAGLLAAPLVDLPSAGSPATLAVATTDDIPDGAALDRTPDIWFIVLDGHTDLATMAAMTEVTGRRVDGFQAFLEDHGFQVQDDARSNYPLTHLSIPSTLEMEYLHEGPTAPPTQPFVEILTGDNETVRTLRAHGYSYAHAYPGVWEGSRCSGIENVCLGEEARLNATKRGLLARTPFTWIREDAETRRAIAEANDPAAVVAAIQDAALPTPSFSFVHLLPPHAPMLRAADCTVRDVRIELNDWESTDAYADAAACLHRQLEDAVGAILADDPDALIVIQGDHGHRFREIRPGDMIEHDAWFSTLSAIRLPSACRGLAIPDDLNLVNTFRVVFSCLLDDPIELLPDRKVAIRLG